ncbi:hypothetical protein CEXT_634251 [Caerostris extrusa]|uniref:Uncharacterized protein n=1 Tax=Caerostris extrusa TaxID=172846 RepID=A0AAV4RFA1_CAEEX|nr:hypothetical protein CEXT_634251 [Caerostris extrusa]
MVVFHVGGFYILLKFRSSLFRIDLSVCKKLVHEALRSRQETLLCFGLKLCLASSIRSFKANNRRRAPVVVCGALLGRGPASIKIDYLGLGNFWSSCPSSMF